MILHIIKKANDSYAWQTASRKKGKGDRKVAVLLIQDGVYSPTHGEMEVFACREDVTMRGAKTKARLVSYEEIVEMLADADSVVCW